jgi:VanZ family protein
MEYAVLFIIVFLTIKTLVAKESTASGLAKSMLFSLLFCFLFAISDEFHQTLVPNRTGKLLDVIIDLFGVFWGQVIILLYVIWRRQD